MATIDELKEVVVETLEANGKLAQLRAELRATVFAALSEEEKFDEDKVEPGRWAQNAFTQLAVELVREYLEFHELDHTLSVLGPEARLPEISADAGELWNAVGHKQVAGDVKKVPVLEYVLKDFMERRSLSAPSLNNFQSMEEKAGNKDAEPSMDEAERQRRDQERIEEEQKELDEAMRQRDERIQRDAEGLAKVGVDLKDTSDLTKKLEEVERKRKEEKAREERRKAQDAMIVPTEIPAAPGDGVGAAESGSLREFKHDPSPAKAEDLSPEALQRKSIALEPLPPLSVVLQKKNEPAATSLPPITGPRSPTGGSPTGSKRSFPRVPQEKSSEKVEDIVALVDAEIAAIDRELQELEIQEEESDKAMKGGRSFEGGENKAEKKVDESQDDEDIDLVLEELKDDLPQKEESAPQAESQKKVRSAEAERADMERMKLIEAKLTKGGGKESSGLVPGEGGAAHDVSLYDDSVLDKTGVANSLLVEMPETGIEKPNLKRTRISSGEKSPKGSVKVVDDYFVKDGNSLSEKFNYVEDVEEDIVEDINGGIDVAVENLDANK